MIIFDTNVVSELMASAPSPAVRRWIEKNAVAEYYTTAVTQAEVLTGLLLLPHGKRRAALEKAAHGMFARTFAGRILPFDERAAPIYADLVADSRRTGRPTAVPGFDMMIAAIAQLHGAAVATRNTRHFAHCGIVLHDPWQETAERG